MFDDDFSVGCGFFDQAFEAGGSGLAVFVVGCDDGPLFHALGFDSIDQHAGLHEGAGANAVGVGIAGAHGDGVGQRFRGDKERLFLVGKVGHGEADIRQEGADQHGHAFAGDEFFCHADGIAWSGTVITDDKLKFAAAEYAALGVDFIEGEIEAVAIRHGEGGHAAIAVELTDFDRGLLCRSGCG